MKAKVKPTVVGTRNGLLSGILPNDLDHLQQAVSIDLRCLENEFRNNTAVGSDVAHQLEGLQTSVENLEDKIKTLTKMIDSLIDTLKGFENVNTLGTKTRP